MLKPLFFALTLAAAAPASSQAPDAAAVPVVTVTLSSFQFDPKEIRLAAGKPVILRLSNTSSGGHDFGAPEFFAAATVDPADAARIKKGEVEVGSHQSVDISLVPAAGTYRLKCDHPLHAAFGMTGQIVVQ